MENSVPSTASDPRVFRLRFYELTPKEEVEPVKVRSSLLNRDSGSLGLPIGEPP